ncbi:MAG: S-layer homology domain-containing protein [Patescibacteria group bacterium]|nr:S-layer homology domain-containing protein [Patescibacteria group bacterium]
MANLKKWWKANQVAAVTGVLVLLVVAFPAGSFLKAQVDPMNCGPNFNESCMSGYMPPGDDPCPGDPCPGVCCGGDTGSYMLPIGGGCYDMSGNPVMSCPDGTCSCYHTDAPYVPDGSSYDPCPGDACPGVCCGGTGTYPPTAPGCGNAMCEGYLMEDSNSCPQDCGYMNGAPAPPGANYGSIMNGSECATQGGIWCKGEDPSGHNCYGPGHACAPMHGTTGYCGDKMCNNGETPVMCPSDCGMACNNDGKCGNGENEYSCPSDCKQNTYQNDYQDNMYNNPSGKDPASYRGDPAGCRSQGYTYCDSIRDCFPPGEDCSRMKSGPQFDFNQGMCDPRDPYCKQGQNFQQRESKMDMYMKDDYSSDNREMGANEASRELKMVKQEVKNEERWLSDVNREFKKLDWTVQSPVLANAKAILDEIQAIFTEVQGAASVSGWGEIESLRDKLDYFRNELRPEFDDIRPQLHVFGELKNFNKELSRSLKDIEREQKRFEKENTPAECKAYLTDAVAAITALQADPFANVDMEFFDGRDLWDQMENIRWDYMDPAFECQREQMQTSWMGQTFEDIGRELEKMAGNVPADMEESLKKAKTLRDKGAACFKAGDIDCAEESLKKLESMKQKFARYMGPMNGPKFGTDMSDILGSRFEDDIAKTLEDKLFSQMSNIDQLINSIVNQVMNRVMEQMAAVLDKVNEQVATKMAKMTENISFASSAIQKKASATQEEVYATVGEVADVAETLSGTAKTAVETVVDGFAGELWTAKTAAELKPHVDSITDLVQNGATNAEIVEESQAVKKLIDNAKKDEQAKRYTEGFVPFKDTNPEDWYTGFAAKAKDLGHVKGEGGTNDLNPSGELLGAHEVVILARELGVDNTCSAPTVTPAGMPDWAKSAVCGLQKKFGSGVLNVIDKPLDQPITREDVAELQVKVLNLPVPSNPDEVLKNFPDKDQMSSGAKAAIAATIEAGIFKGDDSGTFRPQAGMNRAEGVKVNSVAHDIVKSEAAFNE